MLNKDSLSELINKYLRLLPSPLRSVVLNLGYALASPEALKKYSHTWILAQTFEVQASE